MQFALLSNGCFGLGQALHNIDDNGRGKTTINYVGVLLIGQHVSSVAAMYYFQVLRMLHINLCIFSPSFQVTLIIQSIMKGLTMLKIMCMVPKK